MKYDAYIVNDTLKTVDLKTEDLCFLYCCYEIKECMSKGSVDQR